MCGHDTIGVCTALIESGLIPVVEPITSLKLDTPAGLVEVDIFVQDGKAKEVSFVTYQLFTETHYCRRRRHWNCRGGYCVWREFLCHYRCEISRVRVSTRKRIYNHR